jgi:hypothetical protein
MFKCSPPPPLPLPLPRIQLTDAPCVVCLVVVVNGIANLQGRRWTQENLEDELERCGGDWSNHDEFFEL